MLPASASALLLQMRLHHELIDEDRCSCGDDGALREVCEYTQYGSPLWLILPPTPTSATACGILRCAREKDGDLHADSICYSVHIIARSYDAVSAIQLDMVDAILYYAMLCYAMLCYAMLCYTAISEH